MNKNILIFGGTNEGRKLAEFLNTSKKDVFVCVATSYGETLLPAKEHVFPLSGRLTQEEMEDLIEEKAIDLVIDATHPYAQIVSENIKKACENTAVERIRLLREVSEAHQEAIYVESVKEAVAYLSKTKGNIFVTTGSKELSLFTELEEYKERVYPRVLSTPEVALACKDLGFEGRHLICMQGPFSEDLNYSMLKEVQASYLVTKESGRAGGFEEKMVAAQRAGVIPIVIGRPKEEQGYNINQIKEYVRKRYDLPQVETPKISILGIGMGAKEQLTLEGEQLLKEAEVLIGAKRMVLAMRTNQPYFISYKPEEILSYIQEHTEYEKIVILQSGDVGFYSGTKRLLEMLKDYFVQVYPGISSMVFLAAQLGISWEDAISVSLHGRETHPLSYILRYQKVFLLLGGKYTVNQLCEELLSWDLGEVELAVGEDLSYENQKITVGTPLELKEGRYSPLSVVFVFHKGAKVKRGYTSLLDEAFIRGKVPMTKSEVRSLSIAKLKLPEEGVFYDIGAGTGSVSIEMALTGWKGQVYAVERNEEGISLMKENKKKFQAVNLEVVHGLAPDAMEPLPAPSHVFIGGTAGNLSKILDLVFLKNPRARVVITAITLETIAETLVAIKKFSICDLDIASVQVAKSKAVGTYHMMMGANPVYLISFEGVVKDE